MKYARIRVLAETPPGGLTAGIDWGSADHAVCVVDAAGQLRARFGTQDAAGQLSEDELTNTKIHPGTTSRCHLLLCWAHKLKGDHR